MTTKTYNRNRNISHLGRRHNIMHQLARKTYQTGTDHGNLNSHFFISSSRITSYSSTRIVEVGSDAMCLLLPNGCSLKFFFDTSVLSYHCDACQWLVQLSSLFPSHISFLFLNTKDGLIHQPFQHDLSYV